MGRKGQLQKSAKNFSKNSGFFPVRGKKIPRGLFSARGFSLVELIITLAILITVMAIAYPAVQRYAVNGNLRTAARDFTSDFAMAKQKALSENVNYTISFNVGNNQYTISTGMTTETKSLNPYGTSFTTSIPGSGSINFQTRGIVDPGGALTLTNRRGSTATITWNIAGRAYVQFDMR
jgi:prepilin-type N-terminal cleavage/methylation domain-containing protein